MSEPTATPPTGDVPPPEEGEMLQFDQAEFATPAAERPTCSVCHQPIPDEYYEINQRVMCPRCRQGVEAAIRGGSPVARFLKATLLGILASIAGAAVYYAVLRTTHYHIGLIAILVGFMVGGAVRKGTGNRGGRVYQLLAVFLTYSSIVAMYVPLLIEESINAAGNNPGAQAAAGKADPGQAAGAKKADPQEAPDAPPDLAGFVQALVVLVGILYTVPFRVAAEAPITGLIYGFAIWEAWKINRPLQLVFNGPFRLGAAGPGPEVVAHEA